MARKNPKGSSDVKIKLLNIASMLGERTTIKLTSKFFRRLERRSKKAKVISTFTAVICRKDANNKTPVPTPASGGSKKETPKTVFKNLASSLLLPRVSRAGRLIRPSVRLRQRFSVSPVHKPRSQVSSQRAKRPLQGKKEVFKALVPSPDLNSGNTRAQSSSDTPAVKKAGRGRPRKLKNEIAEISIESESAAPEDAEEPSPLYSPIKGFSPEFATSSNAEKPKPFLFQNYVPSEPVNSDQTYDPNEFSIMPSEFSISEEAEDTEHAPPFLLFEDGPTLVKGKIYLNAKEGQPIKLVRYNGFSFDPFGKDQFLSLVTEGKENYDRIITCYNALRKKEATKTKPRNNDSV